MDHITHDGLNDYKMSWKELRSVLSYFIKHQTGVEPTKGWSLLVQVGDGSMVRFFADSTDERIGYQKE